MPLTVDDIRAILKKEVESDIQKAESTFEKLDSRGSKDGFISVDDMGDRAIAGLCKKYDVNADGKVSKAEYMAVSLERAVGKKLHVDDLDDLDLDGLCDRIDLGDFRRLIKIELVENMTPEDDATLVTILQKMRTDGSTMEYKAFKFELLKRYSAVEETPYVADVKQLLRECKKQLGVSDHCREQYAAEFQEMPEEKRLMIVKPWRIDSSTIGLGSEKVVVESEFVRARVVTEVMDKQFQKATGSSSHKNVTAELMRSFLEGNGVVVTESAVDRLFNMISASVSYQDFSRGLVKFVTNSLFE